MKTKVLEMNTKVLDMKKYKTERHFKDAIKRWENKGWIVAVEVHHHVVLYKEREK